MNSLVDKILIPLTILFELIFLSSTKHIIFAKEDNELIFDELNPKTTAFFSFRNDLYSKIFDINILLIINTKKKNEGKISISDLGIKY